MSLTGSQYRYLITEYSKRKAEAERIQREHLDHVRETIPEYALLEDESTDIAIQYGRRALTERGLDLSEMDRKLDEIYDRQTSLLESHGLSRSYLDAPYTCMDCRDTGYIDNVKCHCFKQAEIDLMYNRSNLLERIGSDNFDNLREDIYEGEDLKRYTEAVRICRSFVSTFDDQYDNLMLVGTVGTGKTFLSSCVANELLKTGHSVIYFSASDFFDAYADHKFGRNRDPEDERPDDIHECDLLVIDDLGTEYENQFAATVLFECLNSRHNARKSTLISTNLTLPELHDRYTDRTFSRLTGHYTILKLTGPDLRMKLRNNR